MASIYEITEDIKAINDLIENAVDSEGNPRELTEEEQKTINEWMCSSQEDFEKKFDSYGKIMANLKTLSDVAEAEKKSHKDELDRLSKRAKAFENKRESLKNGLRYAMDVLKITKFKTALFSAGIQNTQIKINSQGNLEGIPEKYLKPRELNTSKVKEDIKNGVLSVKGGFILNLESGELLEGVTAEQGTALVIR